MKGVNWDKKKKTRKDFRGQLEKDNDKAKLFCLDGNELTENFRKQYSWRIKVAKGSS